MMFDYRTHIFYSDEDPEEELVPGEGTETDPEPDQSKETEPAADKVQPKTRREKFLAKIAGEEISIAPKTRREKFLNMISENESDDPGTSGIFTVQFSIASDIETGDFNITADKTVREIVEAYQSGKIVRGTAIKYEYEGAEPYISNYELYAYTDEGSSKNICFRNINDRYTFIERMTIIAGTHEDGESDLWTMYIATIPSHMPTVSYVDNGKFLGVYGGRWDKVNSPIPAVTSSDNGKILGVEGGHWAAIPKLYPEKVEITITGFSSDTDPTATATISSQLQSNPIGKFIIAKYLQQSGSGQTGVSIYRYYVIQEIYANLPNNDDCNYWGYFYRWITVDSQSILQKVAVKLYSEMN